MQLKDIIRNSRGEQKADLLLKNGQVVNVFTGEIVRADVAVAGGLIIGVGEGYSALETIDLDGRFVCPGFIDGHLHIESTMLTPYQFARAVLPHGTTTVICDPHEIANVLGTSGVRYMLEASEGLPISIFIMAPSCVPATHLETAGATLSSDDIATLLDHPRVLGLAEMMNFPGVLLQIPEVLAKLEAAKKRGMPVDGHSPGLTGRDLQAYVAAGITSDHECTRPEEALEKLRAGMYLFIREGTAERNLADLLPVVTAENSRRCILVSDDRHPDDLMDRGHMDYSIRLAVRKGLNPVTAIQMVTLNPAERFRLWDRGAIAPGYRADMVILNNLEDMQVEKVFTGGQLVADQGQTLPFTQPETVSGFNSMRIDTHNLDFAIPAKGSSARVIGVIEGQIVTEMLELPVKIQDNMAVADVERDILKLAVIERHKGTGNVGLGFVRGIGLHSGAIASTVAHDSHNLIIVGTNDADMKLAAISVSEMAGGLVAVDNGQVKARLPLPVAGLMSGEPLESVRKEMDRLLSVARELGSPLDNPFMTLSFLALPVIPALKLTDRGLVDVNKFDFVELFVS
ncbi:adenine deaminase [Desulfohalobiaceae bacterium Ax17]|uniref:adenine deaminase n=1 Tax=Desulfovulcanus ferrireducens TaxID=2831190 RepID=UPI003EC1212B|nr:adenine deaminase [Desulfovulcanus ferrireducens]